MISDLNYPICANKPSGTNTVPNSLPCFHLNTITSAISLTTSYKVKPLSLISSLISTTLGWVYNAHSNTRWDGSLPINLMKYQYLTADAASIIILPISYEYVLAALSNPTIPSSKGWPILLSTVHGTAITLVFKFYFKK